MIKLTALGYDGSIYVNPHLITAFEPNVIVATGNVAGTIIYFDRDNEVRVQESAEDVAARIASLL